MKKIGLMGGLGPASTVDYYMGLVNMTLDEYGSGVYPKIVIDSVDLGEHTKHFNSGDFRKIGDLIYESLLTLKNAGAQVAAVTANTEHIAWDYVKDRLPLPTISIVDATAKACLEQGIEKIVVFATEWTLKSGLYENAFKNFGIEPIAPSKEDMKTIGNLIYPNLENGIVIEKDKNEMITLAEKYIREGNADALLLGCTELPLMIKENDVSVPIVDTTKIHIKALYEYANA